jgi:hypothetical protein
MSGEVFRLLSWMSRKKVLFQAGLNMDEKTFTSEQVQQIFSKYAIGLVITTAVVTFISTYIIFSIIHS